MTQAVPLQTEYAALYKTRDSSEGALLPAALGLRLAFQYL